jgi:hypothetical protein
MGLSDGHIPHRNRAFLVENGHPCDAIVFCLPDSAGTDSGIDDPRLFFHYIDIYSSASHNRRAYASPLEILIKVRDLVCALCTGMDRESTEK